MARASWPGPDVDRTAAALITAWRNHEAVPTLPPELIPAALDDAYAVQERMVAAMGTDLAGWKIGATSPASIAAKGLEEPVWGRLLHHLIQQSPAHVAMDGLFTPHLEAEFAFRMAADLPARGEPYSAEEVAQAVATLYPAIEVADSRMADWRSCSGAATVADNVCHGAAVLGAEVPDWRGLDLTAAAVEVYLNGTSAANGSGARVYGHPLTALAWLANDLNKRGRALAADDLVLTGTCVPLRPMGRGDIGVADFGDLGRVEVTLK